MFGNNHQRHADDLEQRLDTAHQTIEQLKADLATAEYNQRTAITARERAENIAASQRTELVTRAATIRRLRETNTALEKRLAELQAANEAAYADLANRSGANGTATIPGQRKDGAA